MKNNSVDLKRYLLIFICICSAFSSHGYGILAEQDGITFGWSGEGWIVNRVSDNILRSGEIIIPETIREGMKAGEPVVGLESYLFSGIKYIKTVKLPSGITAIPAGCFRNCSNLERIESKNISSLGEECFTNCTSLRFLNGEEIVKNNTLYIPQNLTYIGENVFIGWTVEHLRIQPSDNDSKLRLDWGTFAKMNNLRTAEFSRNCYVKLPEHSDLAFCFPGNPNLEEIRFTKNYIDTDDWYTFSYNYKPSFKNEPVFSLKNAIYYYNQLSQRTNLPALKKVIVENECFEPVAMDYGDAELIVKSEKFLLPDRYELVLVGTDSYYDKDCTGEVYVWEYWDYNFDQAVYWEYGALYSVSKLTIGENVKEICIDRFDNLREITIQIPEPPEWGTNFQKNIYPSAILRVPEQSVELYKNAPGWKDFYSIKPSGVEEIGTETGYVEPEYFDLTGRKVTSPEKGIYILKDARGARKVVL